MSYTRVTKDEYEVQGFWCGQWELETTEETYKAAKEQLKLYRENQPEVAHRIKKIQVKLQAGETAMNQQEYERNQSLAKHLQSQHPDGYYYGMWYPATLLNGQNVEIRRSSGKGRNSGNRYLHIRKPCVSVVRTPEGEELSRTASYSFFRINMQTYEIETE